MAKATHDPRHLVMKLDSPNIVEVTMESKETTTVLRTEVCGASE